MTTFGRRLIEAANEALSIAKGDGAGNGHRVHASGARRSDPNDAPPLDDQASPDVVLAALERKAAAP